MKWFNSKTNLSYFLSIAFSNNIEKDSDSIYTSGMADWRRRHVFFIKCVSVLVIIFFLHQQIGWTQDGSPVWSHGKAADVLPEAEGVTPRGIKVPYDIAEVQETGVVKDKDLIIQIQDAHASLSAQYSIADLLDTLVSKYDLDLIAIEGSRGFVDTSILRTFPDKKVRDEAAEFLMKEGKLSAGEFFTVTHDEADVLLYGIEDESLYQKNLESFQKVAKERAYQVEGIEQLIDQLALLDEKISSENLRKFNKNSRLHKEGRLSFVDHWHFAEELANIHNLDTSRYRELSKLLTAIELEKDINFARANYERRKLMDALSKEMGKDELEELVIKSLDFRENKISQGEFHSYLIDLAEEYGIPSAGYSNLINFTRYINIYESVQLIELHREVEEFEGEIREKLYRNNDEREMFDMIRFAHLLKNLYSMELTNEEFEALKEEYGDIRPQFLAGFISSKCMKYGVPIMGGYDLARIVGGRNKAMKFYYDAEARNSAILENTIKRMRTEGKHVAALITGGYHTEGLNKLIRDKGLSYLVIVPKFEAGKERPYVAILTNKKKPYEELLETGRYQLAIEAYFQDKENKLETIKAILFYAMGRAVLENDMTTKEAYEALRDWAASYRERYFALLEERGPEEMKGKIHPDDFEAFWRDRVEIYPIGNEVAIVDKVGDELRIFAMDRMGEFHSASRGQRDIVLARRERMISPADVLRPASWGLVQSAESKEAVFQALGIETGEGAAQYVTAIIADSGVTVDDLKARVDKISDLGFKIYEKAEGRSLLARSAEQLDLIAERREDMTAFNSKMQNLFLGALPGREYPLGLVLMENLQNLTMSEERYTEIKEDIESGVLDILEEAGKKAVIPLSPEERIELAATKEQVLENLGIETGDEAPAYIKRILASDAISVDDLKERVKRIWDIGPNIYEGEGRSLLAKSVAQLDKMIEKRDAIIEFNRVSAEEFEMAFPGREYPRELLIPVTVRNFELSDELFTELLRSSEDRVTDYATREREAIERELAMERRAEIEEEAAERVIEARYPRGLADQATELYNEAISLARSAREKLTPEVINEDAVNEAAELLARAETFKMRADVDAKLVQARMKRNLHIDLATQTAGAIKMARSRLDEIKAAEVAEIAEEKEIEEIAEEEVEVAEPIEEEEGIEIAELTEEEVEVAELAEEVEPGVTAPLEVASERWRIAVAKMDPLMDERVEANRRVVEAENRVIKALEAAGREDDVRVQMARDELEIAQVEAAGLNRKIRGNITSQEHFYFSVIEMYDEWLELARSEAKEPTLKEKTEKLVDLVQGNLAYWIARDYRVDNLELLIGKKLDILDFALEVIIAREKAPPLPKDIEQIKIQLEAAFDRLFIPGADGIAEREQEIKARMEGYLSDDIMLDFIVNAFLSSPDPERRGERIYIDNIERFERIADEVAVISGLMTENLIDLTFMEFQKEYLGYKKMPDEYRRIDAKARETEEVLRGLEDRLIGLFAGEFPELKIELRERLFTPNMRGIMRGFAIFAILAAITMGSIGCTAPNAYVHNIKPSTMGVQVAIKGEEEEKAAETEDVEAKLEEAERLEEAFGGRIKIRPAKEGPPVTLEPVTEEELWHGYMPSERIHQAFVGGLESSEVPGDVVLTPLMYLESGNRLIIVPKAEDMFDLTVKTEKGKVRWQLYSNVPRLFSRGVEAVKLNEAGELVDAEGKLITGDDVVKMIEEGKIKAIRDNETNNIYIVRKPEVIWVHKRAAGEEEKIGGQNFFPANIRTFDHMSAYSYQRGIAYMDNGDHLKAHQMLAEAMDQAAGELMALGMAQDDMDKYKAAADEGKFLDAYRALVRGVRTARIADREILANAEESVTVLMRMQREVDRFVKETVLEQLNTKVLPLFESEMGDMVPIIHELINIRSELREEFRFNDIMRSLRLAGPSGRAMVLGSKENPIPYSNKDFDLKQMVLKSKLLPDAQLDSLLPGGLTLYVGDTKGTRGMFFTFYPNGFTAGVKYKAHIEEGQAAIFSHITRGITDQGDVPIVFLPNEPDSEDFWDGVRIVAKHILFMVPSPVGIVGAGASLVDSAYEGGPIQDDVNEAVKDLPGGDEYRDRNLKVFQPGEETFTTYYEGTPLEQKISDRLIRQIDAHSSPVEGLEGRPLKELGEAEREMMIQSMAISIIGHPLGEKFRQLERVNAMVEEGATIEDVIHELFRSKDWENASDKKFRRDGKPADYLLNRTIWNIFRQRTGINRSAKSRDGRDNLVFIPVYTTPKEDAPYYIGATIEEHYSESGKLFETKIQDNKGTIIKRSTLPDGRVQEVRITAEHTEDDVKAKRFKYKKVILIDGNPTGSMSSIEVQYGLPEELVRTIERIYDVNMATNETRLTKTYITMEDSEGEIIKTYTIEPDFRAQEIEETPGMIDERGNIVIANQFKGRIAVNFPGRIEAESIESGAVELTQTDVELTGGAVNVLSTINIEKAANAEGYLIPEGSVANIEKSPDGRRIVKVTFLGPARPGIRRPFITSFESSFLGELDFNEKTLQLKGYRTVREFMEDVAVEGKAQLAVGERTMINGSRLRGIRTFTIDDAGRKVPKEMEFMVLNPDNTRNITYVNPEGSSRVYIMEGDQFEKQQVAIIGEGDNVIEVIAQGDVSFKGKLLMRQVPIPATGVVKGVETAEGLEDVELPSVSYPDLDVVDGTVAVYTYAEDGRTVKSVGIYSPLDRKEGRPRYPIMTISNPDGFAEGEGMDLDDPRNIKISGYTELAISRGHEITDDGTVVDILEFFDGTGALDKTVYDTDNPERGRVVYTETAPDRVYVEHEKTGLREVWHGTIEKGELVATVGIEGDLAYVDYVDDAEALRRAGEDPDLAGQTIIAMADDLDHLVRQVTGVTINPDGTVDKEEIKITATFEGEEETDTETGAKRFVVNAKNLAEADEAGNIRYVYDNVILPGKNIGRVSLVVREDGSTQEIEYEGNTSNVSKMTSFDKDDNIQEEILLPEPTDLRAERMKYQKIVYENGEPTDVTSTVNIQRGLIDKKGEVITRIIENVYDNATGNHINTYVTVQDSTGRVVKVYSVAPGLGEESVEEIAARTDERGRIIEPLRFRGKISVTYGDELGAASVDVGTLMLSAEDTLLTAEAVNILYTLDIPEDIEVEGYSIPAGSIAVVEKSPDAKRIVKVSYEAPAKPGIQRDLLVSFESPFLGELDFDEVELSVTGYERVRESTESVSIEGTAEMPVGERPVPEGSRLVGVRSFVIVEGEKVLEETEFIVFNPDGARNLTYINPEGTNLVYIFEGNKTEEQQVGVVAEGEDIIEVVRGGDILFKGRLYKDHKPLDVPGSVKGIRIGDALEELELPFTEFREQNILDRPGISYTYAEDGKTITEIGIYSPLKRTVREPRHLLVSITNPEGFAEGEGVSISEANDITFSGYTELTISRGHESLETGGTLDILEVYDARGALTKTVYDMNDPVIGRIFYTVDEADPNRVYVQHEATDMREVWFGKFEDRVVKGEIIARIGIEGNSAYLQYVDDAELLEKVGEDPDLAGQTIMTPADNFNRIEQQVAGVVINPDGTVDTSQKNVIAAFEGEEITDPLTGRKIFLVTAKDLTEPTETGDIRYEYEDRPFPGRKIGRLITITRADGSLERTQYYGYTARVKERVLSDEEGKEIYTRRFGYGQINGQPRVFETNTLIDEVAPAGYWITYETEAEISGIREDVQVDPDSGDVKPQDIGARIPFEDFMGGALRDLMFGEDAEVPSMTKDEFSTVLGWKKNLSEYSVRARNRILREAAGLKDIAIERYIEMYSSPKRPITPDDINLTTAEGREVLGTLIYWSGGHGIEDFDNVSFRNDFNDIAGRGSVKKYLKTVPGSERWTDTERFYRFTKFVGDLTGKKLRLGYSDEEVEGEIKAQIRIARGERIEKVVSQMEKNIQGSRLVRFLVTGGKITGAFFILFLGIAILLAKLRPAKKEEAEAPDQIEEAELAEREEPQVLISREVPQALVSEDLLGRHEEINRQISGLRDEGKFTQITPEEKEAITGALENYRDIEALSDGRLLEMLNTFDVFIYEVPQDVFITGQTTHIGISTKSIHITRNEFERLRRLGLESGIENGEDLFLAARFAHELYEVDGLNNYYVENTTGVWPNTRDWIKYTLRRRAGPEGVMEYEFSEEARNLIEHALMLHRGALKLESDILPEDYPDKSLIDEQIRLADSNISALQETPGLLPVLTDINIAADLINTAPLRYDFNAAEDRIEGIVDRITDTFWQAHGALEPIYYDRVGKKVKPAALMNWTSIPAFLAGIGFLSINMRNALETGLATGYGWSVWAAGAILLLYGIFTASRLIRDIVRSKKDKLARQAEAMDILQPELNEIISELEKLIDEGADGFTGEEWKKMLTFTTQPRYAAPADIIARETMEINLYDYMRYTREWIEFLRKNNTGDYILYSRFHTPKGDVQRNLPTFYLKGKEFTTIYRDNEYNKFTEVLPGAQRPVPEDVPYNGPREYHSRFGFTPVHQVPLTNLPTFAARLRERIESIDSLYREGKPLDFAVERDAGSREWRVKQVVRQAKGYGGVGPARSSTARGVERHGFRLKGAFVSLILFGLLSYFLRIMLTRVISIPETPDLNAVISVLTTITAAMMGYMVTVMIEKVVLFANSFRKRAKNEGVIDRDIARFVSARVSFEALSEILGEEEFIRRQNESVERLTQKGVFTGYDPEDPEVVSLVSQDMIESISNEYSGLKGWMRSWGKVEPSKWPLNRLRLEYPILEVITIANREDRQGLIDIIKSDERLAANYTPEEFDDMEAAVRYTHEDVMANLSLDDVRYMISTYGEELLPKYVIMDTTFGKGAGANFVRMVESAREVYERPIDIFPVMDDDDYLRVNISRRNLLSVLRGLVERGFIAFDEARIDAFRADETIDVGKILDEVKAYGEARGMEEDQAVMLLEEYEKDEKRRDKKYELTTGIQGGLDEIRYVLGGENIKLISPARKYILDLMAERGEVPPEGTLSDYRGNVNIVPVSDFGINYLKFQRKPRMKPPMNAEAVKAIQLFYAERGEPDPDYLELADEEDRFTRLLFRAKTAVWAMRERTVNEQISGIVNEEDEDRWLISYEPQRKELETEYTKAVNSLKEQLETDDAGIIDLLDRDQDEMRDYIARQAGQSDEDLARNRVIYMTWAFLKTYPPEIVGGQILPSEEFINSEFRLRNVPAVIQTELRLVPLYSPKWSILSYLDYLFWHATVQVGQTVAGFLFLGGTGNGFLWETLAYTKPVVDETGKVLEEVPLSVRANLQELLRPLREAIQSEETKREESIGSMSMARRFFRRLGLMISPDKEIKTPSAALREHLTQYQVSGAWDAMNQIEDAELGSRLALYRLKATRLVGSFTQVLEDLLPALGPGWLKQRIRWITLQAFWSIVSFGPAFWMFFGQHIGLGSVWSLIGSRNLMLAFGGFGSIIGIGLSIAGFLIFGVLFYKFGKALYTLRTRAGLERNEQWQVDPIKTMGWRKFQHMAYLSSTTFAGTLTAIMLGVPVIYFLATLAAESTFLPGAGPAGILISVLGHATREFLNVLFGYFPTTMVGGIFFLTPPVTLTLMVIITAATRAIMDEEATAEALRKRIEDKQFRKLKGIGDVHVADYAEPEEIIALLSPYEAELADVRSRIRELLEADTEPDEIVDQIREKSYAFGAYRELRLSLLNPERRDIERFQRALGEILEEVESIRRDALGAIHISPGVGVVGVLSFLTTGILYIGGWMPHWVLITGLVFSGILMALKGVDLLVRYVGKRQYAFIVGRRPKHALKFGALSPAMIHYWNNIAPASIQDIQRSFVPRYAGEFFWTRGRAAIVKFALGEIRTLKKRIQQLWLWTKYQGVILGLLFILPFMSIIGLSVLSNVQAARAEKARALVLEPTIRNYIEGNINLTPKQKEDLFKDEREGVKDLRGTMMVQLVDEYEKSVREDRITEAQRSFELLVLYTEFLRQRYQREGERWDFEYFTDHLQQMFARLGMLDEYYKLFGIDPDDVIKIDEENSSIRVSRKPGGTDYEINEDGTITFDVDLVQGENLAELEFELKEPVDMRGREFVFEFFIPEAYRENLAGHTIMIVAYDDENRPQTIIEMPGYSGGEESKFEIVEGELLEKLNTLRIKPEKPIGSAFNPARAKRFVIRVNRNFIKATSGQVRIGVPRIVPRASLAEEIIAPPVVVPPVVKPPVKPLFGIAPVFLFGLTQGEGFSPPGFLSNSAGNINSFYILLTLAIFVGIIYGGMFLFGRGRPKEPEEPELPQEAEPAPVYQVAEDGTITERYEDTREIKRIIEPDGKISEYAKDGRRILFCNPQEGKYFTYRVKKAIGKKDLYIIIEYEGVYQVETGQEELAGISEDQKRQEWVYVLTDIYDHTASLQEPVITDWVLDQVVVYDAEGKEEVEYRYVTQDDKLELNRRRAAAGMEIVDFPGNILESVFFAKDNVKFHFRKSEREYFGDPLRGKPFRIEYIGRNESDYVAYHTDDPRDMTIRNVARRTDDEKSLEISASLGESIIEGQIRPLLARVIPAIPPEVPPAPRGISGRGNIVMLMTVFGIGFLLASTAIIFNAYYPLNIAIQSFIARALPFISPTEMGATVIASSLIILAYQVITMIGEIFQGKAAPKPDIVVGILKGTVDEVVIERIERSDPSIRVVEVMPGKTETMIEELSKAAKDEGIDAVVLIDTPIAGYNRKEATELIIGTANKLRADVFTSKSMKKLDKINREILRLQQVRSMIRRTQEEKDEIDAKIKTLTGQKEELILSMNVGAIRGLVPSMSGLELRDLVHQLSIGGIEIIKSMELSEQSIYRLTIDIRHKDIYARIRTTDRTKAYAATGLVEGEPRYISEIARNVGEMRLIADTIRSMGLDKEKASRFIQVRVLDPNITEKNLDMMLEETGLVDVLDRGNIRLITQEDLTLERTLELARSTFPELDIVENPDALAIGDIANLVKTDADERIIQADRAPTFVQMVGEGVVSQRLVAILEIIANKGVISESLGEVNPKEGYKNWLIFEPIKPINFENLMEEMKRYEEVIIRL